MSVQHGSDAGIKALQHETTITSPIQLWLPRITCQALLDFLSFMFRAVVLGRAARVGVLRAVIGAYFR